MLERDALISKATMDEKIKIIEEEAVRANLTNLLLKAQKDNTEAGTKKTLQDIKTQQAQIDKWAKEIAQGWMALEQKDREIMIKKFEAEMKANFPGLGQVLGNAVNSTMEGITKSLTGKGTLKPYKVE